MFVYMYMLFIREQVFVYECVVYECVPLIHT